MKPKLKYHQNLGTPATLEKLHARNEEKPIIQGSHRFRHGKGREVKMNAFQDKVLRRKHSRPLRTNNVNVI